MMKFVLTAAVAVLSLSVALAGEPVKAGPQKGEDLPGPFHPLNVTGDNAGEKACLFCKFGGNPVAMVFARSATPEVTKLVKQLDAAIAKHKDAELCGCAIFCSDDGALKGKLEEIAKKDKVEN